jgi:deoxyribonuclease V
MKGVCSMQRKNIDLKKLVSIQKVISTKALETLGIYDGRSFSRVVGLDAAYSKKYGGVGVAVLVDFNTCKPIDYGIAIGEPTLEYIPGLLAFREAALLYTALLSLGRTEYDLIIVDGHGIAHPRHAGIATHIGLALGKPSIGVAKKKLYGIYKEIRSVDECTNFPCVVGEVVDKYRQDLVLAYGIVPRRGSRSLIYVGPGAFISQQKALDTVIELLKKMKARLPCPTLYADKFSKHIARSLDKGVLNIDSIRNSKPKPLDFYIA